jgi:hypothetical protein
MRESCVRSFHPPPDRRESGDPRKKQAGMQIAIGYDGLWQIGL